MGAGHGFLMRFMKKNPMGSSRLSTTALKRTLNGRKTYGGYPKSGYPVRGTKGKHGMRTVIRINAFASAIPTRLNLVKR